jgi:hypothetical protein
MRITLHYNMVQNGNVLSCNTLSALRFLSGRSSNYSSLLSFWLCICVHLHVQKALLIRLDSENKYRFVVHVFIYIPLLVV